MSDESLEDYSSSDNDELPTLQELEDRQRQLRLDVAQLQADFDRLKQSFEDNREDYYDNGE